LSGATISTGEKIEVSVAVEVDSIERKENTLGYQDGSDWKGSVPNIFVKDETRPHSEGQVLVAIVIEIDKKSGARGVEPIDSSGRRKISE
jgi:hypothetical protein